MVVLMEGAEGIRNLSELEEWYELGCALDRSRLGGYALLRRLERTRSADQMMGENFSQPWQTITSSLISVTWMNKPQWKRLIFIADPLSVRMATAFRSCQTTNSNRHFSDRILEGIIERDGVVGVVPYNPYLKVGWIVGKNKREEVPLRYVADHIDHICQIAGDALHAGIGSDFDGGFGLQSVPPEIDTVADLQNLVSLLQARGYSETDIANILGGNWITRLKRDLPK